MARDTRTAPALTLAALVALAAPGCDRDADTDSQKAEAAPPTRSDRSAEPGSGDHENEKEGDHEDEHEHEGEHGEDHVHLAGPMYELSRRFATVWFAGRAGNAQMVHYQIHEAEELIAELEEASPTENGVDVVARLNDDILPNLEKLEKAAASGDTESFEKTYRKTMNNCTSCHADTGHPQIRVKIPEYNPYPNLEMSPDSD